MSKVIILTFFEDDISGVSIINNDEDDAPLIFDSIQSADAWVESNDVEIKEYYKLVELL